VKLAADCLIPVDTPTRDWATEFADVTVEIRIWEIVKLVVQDLVPVNMEFVLLNPVIIFSKVTILHSMTILLVIVLILYARDLLECIPQWHENYHQSALKDHKILVARVSLSTLDFNFGWWSFL
jgi:hypothetical protein